MTASALERILQRPRAARHAATAGPACELCGQAVPDGHGHVLDEQHREPRCACRACALLFDREAAAEGRYRLIPERRDRLPAFDAEPLGVPVGLAFVVRRAGGEVVANYPSPLGMTQWEIDAGMWQGVVDKCPPLGSMLPEVEALLINTVRGADQRWLVSVDVCFRLVALIRREWEGLSGGRRVWSEIERFFDALAARGGK